MDPFIGEIHIFAGNFAPKGWALCNGQLLAISTNTALFSLIGTFYGGDGKTTFALPNLQAAAPISQGQGPGLTSRVLGETGGVAQVKLVQSEMPVHTHTVSASTDASTGSDPSNAVWAVGGQTRGGVPLYNANANPPAQMNPTAISEVGGDQPHNNMPPSLALTFIIALQGIYPPRS
jgi:microcystin-dependent protein